ncbi:MAG: DUF4276 family protein [Verrucomicrobia bacterium]|nr:DUF4276 family protein [Verrucomicrobiota bacterium]
MSAVFIAPIVEGKAEVEAVPKLLHRLCRHGRRPALLRVNPPIRVKAGSFLNDEDYFRRYVELASRKAQVHSRGNVLILLDCEDDCAGKLGPRLLAQARQVHAQIPFTVVLAHREYETWFLAAAPSLRSVGGLPEDLEAPADPEAIRGAKEWLAARMPTGYDPPNHQPLFSERFSLAQAAVVPSFARLQRKVQDLFSC